MKPGDLVKYKFYHDSIQHLRGLVLRVDRTEERAYVLWNRPESNADDVFDWVEDLEVVNGSNSK